MAKEKLVIIGSGWAGYEVLRCVSRKLYDVTIISPRYHALKSYNPFH
jgi:NADH dehydrogenase FAD-containing subunit